MRIRVPQSSKLSPRTSSQKHAQTSKSFDTIPTEQTSITKLKLPNPCNRHNNQKFAGAHGRAFIAAEDSRGIIYRPTIASAQELFDYLQADLDVPAQASSIVCLYHGNLTQQEKAEADSAWRSGRSPWIIATSGFGVGVDVPNVRWVIHYGQSYSLADFYQESGRASRDGKPGLSLSVTTVDFANKYMKASEAVTEVQRWQLNMDTCRRTALNRNFDGVFLHFELQ
jgi:superfamily II DNA helicase RecQ